ncbi:acyl-CoA dehydrogenase family protein [Paraburkholderia aromaticivorans]|uniref:acyl-CoA dehydrogenase family protein n=1 Tax=Paraburkholderia aromaticivorans TaxID=2026199 RepID=UPI0014561691|nr:acyl-CoA dehydrogenase family protein [Paraburkholderia aromaticivorans]
MREILESSIDRLLNDAVNPHLLDAAQRGEWPTALWQALEEGGFASALVAEDRGGVGASWSDACAIARALGRHAAPVPLGEAMLASHLLAAAGLGVPTGVLTIAGAASEIVLTADAHRWLATGHLRGVPWGRHADAVVCVATDGQTHHVVLLPVAQAKLTAVRNTAGEPRDELVFEHITPLAAAPLPCGLPSNVVALYGAMLRSAQTAGALERVLDMCVAYANERVQFGRHIGKFQAIQHQLAVFASQAASVSAATEFAFAMADAGDAGFAIAAAKIRASEVAGLANSIAHAVHGAIGFSHEFTLHFLTRRLWSWRSEYGSQSHWSERLGRLACTGGANAFWPLITGNGVGAVGRHHLETLA